MGKLVNIKKSLSIFFVLFFCFVTVFAQSNSGFKLNNPDSTEIMDESNIVFEENITTSQNNKTEMKGPSTAGYLVRIIIVLIIVIGLIYGVFWYLKRKTNVVKNEDEFLRRAAYLNIAPGKTVEVITLIDKAYLIGVTDDNITMLGEITDKELINAMNVNADKNQNIKKPLNFSEVLDIFTAKGKKSTNIFTETENKVEKMFNSDNSNNEGAE